MPGALVHDNPTTDGDKEFGLITDNLFIPFQTAGVTVYFDSIAPTHDEVEQFMHQGIGPTKWNPLMVWLQDSSQPNRRATEIAAIASRNGIPFNVLSLNKQAIELTNKFVEQMFQAGNFSFLSERCNDRAPNYDDPDPNNLPHDNPFNTGDNSCKVDSAQQSPAPLLPSQNPSPALPLSPSSSETSDSPSQTNVSPSCTRPSFFSSTGMQTSDIDSNHILSKFSS